MWSAVAQRCELGFCPPFRLLSSTIPRPLQPRFPSIFTFPTTPSLPVSMRSSMRSPLQFLYGLVKKLPSVLSRDPLGALLCCPCTRYWSEKSPQRGQGPDNTRLPGVCRGHLPLALPDQEAISICSDLAALPSPGRTQCTLTEGSRPSLSPRPSIVKTPYSPCAAVQLWKPLNRVPVVQTRPQACNCTNISSSACAAVLIV